MDLEKGQYAELRGAGAGDGHRHGSNLGVFALVALIDCIALVVAALVHQLAPALH